MRAQSLLARHPGLGLTLAAAAFVATLPAASAAPFLSSARSATLHRQIDHACQWDLGATRRIPYADRAAFEQAAAPHHIARLGPPVRTMRTELVAHTSTRPDVTTRLILLARDGFADHVTLRTGPVGRGLWLPADYADANRLSVGDTVTFTGSQTVTIQVAAVYADLDERFWCSAQSGYTAPVALLDWENMLGLGDQPPLATELAVEHAVLDPDRLTQPEAAATARRIDEFDARSTLKQRADEAEAVRRAMLGPIVPLTVTGVLAGLVVLAAAARRWARRLAAAGGRTAIGPAELVVEAFPALAAGVLGGGATAWALVRAAGPSPLLSPEAAPLTLLASGAVLLAAAGVTGAAVAARRTAIRHWELVPLAAAYPVWRATHSLIVVPLLVAIGLAPLLTSLGTRLLASTPKKTAAAGSLLARRRLSAQARMGAILAAAVAVPTALVAYGDAVLVAEPVRYAYGYLIGLCLLTAVIVVVILLLYVESRVTERRRAWVLLRRMGMRRRTHLRALGVEIGVPLTAGLVTGLALAAGLARLLAETHLRLGTVAILAGAVAAVVVGVAGYAQHRVAR